MTTIATASDRTDSYAGKALFASAIGYAMDGFDLLILGFMLRAISAELHLTPPQAGSLVTWTLIGAVAGGILFGILSDYYGRVRVLTWTILLFAVFTGLCAFAQGYWDLLVYRTIAGLGLGGEFGIGMALVAEAWPAAKRARACSYVALGWQAGVLAAALVTPLLLPAIGWRGMFVVGLIPGVIAFAVRWYVGEPQIFLDRAGRSRGMAPLRLLVKDGETSKISLGMLILCGVQNFGYYGVMIWLPSYLSTRFGFGLTQSALWTAVTILGMALGIWVFGVFADRVGRRPALLTFQAGAFVMVLVYSQLTRRQCAAGRRRGDGAVRQRHAGRLWRAPVRALPDRGAGHRRERAVQPRARHRRLRTVRGRRAGGELFVRGGDRALGDNLPARHRGDAVAHSGEDGRPAGVAGRHRSIDNNKRTASRLPSPRSRSEWWGGVGGGGRDQNDR
jgi:MFS family permease